MRHALPALLLLALSVACAAPAPRLDRLRDSDYPGDLLPPEALGRDVLLQQYVSASWGDETRSFDAALQQQSGVLTVIAMSPAGTPGLVIRYDGEHIEQQAHAHVQLPFPPRFILLDVQRAFWPWLGDDPAEPRPEGVSSGEVGGERITERVERGRLLERRFERLDGMPPGVLRVSYAYAEHDTGFPSSARLENGWFGYTLQITTRRVTPLPPVDASPEPAR